ncbi:zinc ribbon domain-containing protein [Cellulomonas biazotea]|nr:zinc ribbon domain-containing protein [Cellulomonas biazotea]
MIVCPSCGTRNEDDEQFCGGCGSYLEWDEPAVAEEPAAAAAADDHATAGAVGLSGTTGATGATGGDAPATTAVLPRPEPPTAPGTDDLTVGSGGSGTTTTGAAVAGAEATTTSVPATTVTPDTPVAPSSGRRAAATPDRPGTSSAPAATGSDDGPTLPDRQPGPSGTPAREAAERETAARAAADQEAAARRAAEDEVVEREAEQQAEREAAAREAEREAAERRADQEAAERKAAEQAAARSATAAAMLAPPPRPKPAPAAVAPTQPAPVKPGTPQAPRPQRPAPKADDTPPQPGDLVCGRCGAGNTPTRRFCRACGTSLADAPVAQRRSWWSRLWRPDPRVARAAGYRPPRRRRFPTRPVVVILVIGALVAVVLAFRPEIERARIALVDRVQGNTAVNPVAIAASSELPDRPAAQIRDGATNLAWSPATPGDGVGQFVDFAFGQPFRLTRVLVIPGASDVEKDFLEGSSPEVLTLTATTSAGTQQTVEIPLDDRVGLQSASPAIDDVVAVRLTISSTFRATPETHVAIAEVEFRGRD